MFFAIGFDDFDTSTPEITGVVSEPQSRGRGGFTNEEEDNYKFKVPQLYNLADSDIFGHGASFSSVQAVVEHKNAGISQKLLPEGTLDSRVQPLGLTEQQIDDLVVFLEDALYDPNLLRYVPSALPSGQCFPNNDEQTQFDLGC